MPILYVGRLGEMDLKGGWGGGDDRNLQYTISNDLIYLMLTRYEYLQTWFSFFSSIYHELAQKCLTTI